MSRADREVLNKVARARIRGAQIGAQITCGDLEHRVEIVAKARIEHRIDLSNTEDLCASEIARR